MIYGPLSFFTRSAEKALASGAVVADSGQAMVHSIQNGAQVTQPAAGSAGEIFLGFANLQTSATPTVPATAVKVEDIEAVPSTGIIVASKTPVAGTVSVQNAATKATIAVVSVTGNNIDVAVGSAGLAVTLVYTHALTVTEARALVGDIQPGGYSGHTYGQVGIGQEGVIYTSVFNSAVNWNLATAVKLAAGGKVTDQTGTGVAINAVVTRVPSKDYPFLGLQFSSAF